MERATFPRPVVTGRSGGHGVDHYLDDGVEGESGIVADDMTFDGKRQTLSDSRTFLRGQSAIFSASVYRSFPRPRPLGENLRHRARDVFDRELIQAGAILAAALMAETDDQHRGTTYSYHRRRFAFRAGGARERACLRHEAAPGVRRLGW